MNKLFYIPIVLVSLLFSTGKALYGEESVKRKLIILSIDGFPGYYAGEDSREWSSLRYLPELAGKSAFSNKVRSTFPTLTYPAHTTMITGVDPFLHGIFYNNPYDPESKLKGDWFWYDSDIRVKTIFDFAKEANLKTANLYWPVTVGANIDFSIPQFWSSKTEDDRKILSALSTPGLYKFLKKKTKSYVGEFTGDIEKIESALALWEAKSPDLMLVYSTDLDTFHHTHGVSSGRAFEKLKTIDKLVGKMIAKLDLWNRNDLAFLIVSDHGFKRVDGICYPNVVLSQNNLVGKNQKKKPYQFKSLGGSAVLLDNSEENSRKASRSTPVDKISSLVSSACPGVKVLKEKSDTLLGETHAFFETSLILYSENNSVFSESFRPTKPYRATNPVYYNHGFLPGDSDMETISIFYTPGAKPEPIENLNQVLMRSCNWLGISCKPGESRNFEE